MKRFVGLLLAICLLVVLEVCQGKIPGMYDAEESKKVCQRVAAGAS